MAHPEHDRLLDPGAQPGDDQPPVRTRPDAPSGEARVKLLTEFYDATRGQEPYGYRILWPLLFLALLGTTAGFAMSLWGTVRITWAPLTAGGALQMENVLYGEPTLLELLYNSSCSLVNAARINSTVANRSLVDVADRDSYNKIKVMSCHMQYLLDAGPAPWLNAHFVRVQDLQVAGLSVLGVALALWVLIEYTKGYLDRTLRRLRFLQRHPECAPPTPAHPMQSPLLPKASTLFDSGTIESKLWRRILRPAWHFDGTGDAIPLHLRLRLLLAFLAVAAAVMLAHAALQLTLLQAVEQFLAAIEEALGSFPDVTKIALNYSYSYWIAVGTSAVDIAVVLFVLYSSIRYVVHFPRASDLVLLGTLHVDL